MRTRSPPEVSKLLKATRRPRLIATDTNRRIHAYNVVMDLVYLDNNATTRPAPQVVEAMLPFFTDLYGNPSSVHRFGQRARQALDEARGRIASLIGCGEGEVAFTGGGTESVNTAIRGLLAARSPRKRVVI